MFNSRTKKIKTSFTLEEELVFYVDLIRSEEALLSFKDFNIALTPKALVETFLKNLQKKHKVTYESLWVTPNYVTFNHPSIEKYKIEAYLEQNINQHRVWFSYLTPNKNGVLYPKIRKELVAAIDKDNGTFKVFQNLKPKTFKIDRVQGVFSPSVFGRIPRQQHEIFKITLSPVKAKTKIKIKLLKNNLAIEDQPWDYSRKDAYKALGERATNKDKFEKVPPRTTHDKPKKRTRLEVGETYEIKLPNGELMLWEFKGFAS